MSKSKGHPQSIQGAGETDVIVSVPAIAGAGRQSILGGEVKMYFELSKGNTPDIQRLPSGPLRNGVKNNHAYI